MCVIADKKIKVTLKKLFSISIINAQVLTISRKLKSLLLINFMRTIYDLSNKKQ